LDQARILPVAPLQITKQQLEQQTPRPQATIA